MSVMDAGKRKFIYLIPVIMGFFTAFFLAFSLFVAAAFLVLYAHPGYFQHEYEKYDVLSNLPEMTMSEEDGLMKVSNHMMDYLLHGEEPEELQVEAMVGGEMRPFFSQREIDHMADVRNIFMICIRFFALDLIAAILLQFFSRMLVCHDEPKRFSLSNGIGLAVGTVSYLCGIGVLIYAITRDFDAAFIKFHHMFFNNDLWLLNPNEDLMINFLPESFFADTALRIGVLFIVFMLLMLAVGIFLIIRGKKMPDFQYAAF